MQAYSFKKWLARYYLSEVRGYTNSCTLLSHIGFRILPIWRWEKVSDQSEQENLRETMYYQLTAANIGLTICHLLLTCHLLHNIPHAKQGLVDVDCLLLLTMVTTRSVSKIQFAFETTLEVPHLRKPSDCDLKEKNGV
jgi:hypothetical protein